MIVYSEYLNGFLKMFVCICVCLNTDIYYTFLNKTQEWPFKHCFNLVKKGC